MNQLRFIRQTIYALKRRYGLKVDFYQTTSVSTNRETGVKTVNKQKYTVRKAIVLPGRLIRDFVYDLAYIAANKNFTQGGYYDHEERWLLIDSSDLPIVPDIEDYIVFNHERYDIKEVNHYEDMATYSIKVKRIKGTDPSEFQILNLTDEIVFGHSVVYEVET